MLFSGQSAIAAAARIADSQLRNLIVAGAQLPTLPAGSAAFTRAGTYFCRRAARGSIDALVGLGWLHLHGAGVPTSTDIAASLFRRAAAHGHAKARRFANALSADKDQLPDCLKAVQTNTAQLATSAATKADAASSRKGSARQRHRSRVAKMVAKLARRYRLDPRLVLAIVQLESGFRTKVISPQNAQGLMQLTPDTAKRFGVKDSSNWVQNLHGGMAYLRWLLAYFEGDVILVAAAYNAGEGNVNKYGGVPPFKETMDYVAKIRAIYHRDSHPYNPRISSASRVVARLRNQSDTRTKILAAR